MINKKSYIVSEWSYPEEKNFKVGDTVRIIDGSALTCDKSETDIYIVFSYPELTGNDTELKQLDFKIKQLGINNHFCGGVGNKIYRQDALIEYNGVEFRTNSQALFKQEN